jgi:hypothetical protein
MPHIAPSRRGLQFSNTTMPELIDTLARTQARVRLVDGLLRSSTDESLVDGQSPMTREQLADLRREMVALQSDLRVELRRRGE